MTEPAGRVPPRPPSQPSPRPGRSKAHVRPRRDLPQSTRRAPSRLAALSSRSRLLTGLALVLAVLVLGVGVTLRLLDAPPELSPAQERLASATLARPAIEEVLTRAQLDLALGPLVTTPAATPSTSLLLDACRLVDLPARASLQRTQQAVGAAARPGAPVQLRQQVTLLRAAEAELPSELLAAASRCSQANVVVLGTEFRRTAEIATLDNPGVARTGVSVLARLTPPPPAGPPPAVGPASVPGAFQAVTLLVLPDALVEVELTAATSEGLLRASQELARAAAAELPPPPPRR